MFKHLNAKKMSTTNIFILIKLFMCYNMLMSVCETVSLISHETNERNRCPLSQHTCVL